VGDSRDALGGAGAVMAEEPQARWVSVWVPGTGKGSVQSPAECVFIACASSTGALLHPFPPSLLVADAIRTARAVLAPGL